MKLRIGFTLIELMIVIAIIAIMAALMFPAFVQAKKSANKTATISNLRQCGLSLLMYSDEHDGGAAGLPGYEHGKALLKSAPTCDRSDYWRTGCAEDWGRPLIGSYGYVRGVESWDKDWQPIFHDRPSATLLISIFYAKEHVAPFHGDVPPLNGLIIHQFPQPTSIVRLRMDGGIQTTRITNFNPLSPGTGDFMTWSKTFLCEGETVAEAKP